MARGNFASASLGNLPPPPSPEFRLIEPLVCENTRFNADRTHRFTLFRHWGDPARYVACIGMNPSGAQEDFGDNTIFQLCKFAREYWAFGALYMLNALSIRLTDSTSLPPLDVANLPENDVWIRRCVRDAGLIVVCWGVPGHRLGRGAAIEKILLEECHPSKVKCFGRTKDGAPMHPRAKTYTTPLVPYFTAGA